MAVLMLEGGKEQETWAGQSLPSLLFARVWNYTVRPSVLPVGHSALKDYGPDDDTAAPLSAREEEEEEEEMKKLIKF